MKFYYKPNHAVIQNIVQKQTGHSSRHVVCNFDANGELETVDDRIIFVLQNKLPECTWDDSKVVAAYQVKEILSDDDIRQLAKTKNIKSWHTKSIKRLKEELEV